MNTQNKNNIFKKMKLIKKKIKEIIIFNKKKHIFKTLA